MLQAFSTSVIPPHEFRVGDLLAPEDAIKAAAASVSIGKPMGMLLQCFPSLEAVVIKLAKQITHVCPSSEGSCTLLSHALEDALKGYRSSADRDGTQRDMQIQFMVALLDRAATLADWDVHAVDGMGEGERWELLQEPLYEWARKHADKRLVFTEREIASDEREAVRTMLVGQILTVKDARLVRQSTGK